MPLDQRAELRALALWHRRRRALDECLESLTAYGPLAVDRVADRLPDVQDLVAAENRAFQSFVALVGERPAGDGVVVDLFAHAARADAD